MQEEVYEICVIGTIVVDSIFEVPQFPRDGETMEASSFSIAVGGGGAAQAVAAARLIGRAIIAGQIGEDETGKIVEKELEKAGVNIKYLKKIKEAQTGVGYITLTSTGHNSIIASFGANLSFNNLQIIPKEFQEAIDKGKYILLQRGIPNEVNELIAKYAHSTNKIVCLDTGGRSDPYTDDLLGNLDFITPNEVEFSLFCDLQYLRKIEVEQLIGQAYSENIQEVIGAKLLDKFPNLKVLLRLGANGCALVTRNLYFKLPVISFANPQIHNPQILHDYKIIDVTGGGDSWIAAFFCKYSQLIGKYSEEVLYRKSMLYANTCAFLCLTQKGCVPSMPNAKSVNTFIQKYLKHLDI